MEGNAIFSHHLMYQAVLLTGFFKRGNKMAPSEMNRETANQRAAGLTWIEAPRPLLNTVSQESQILFQSLQVPSMRSFSFSFGWQKDEQIETVLC